MESDLDSLNQRNNAPPTSPHMMTMPIETVSSDILIEVFRYVLHNRSEICLTQNRPSVFGEGRTHPLIDLSLVCRSWREMTLDYGPFWSNFEIKCHLVNEDTLGSLEVILQRSKECPIDFRMTHSTILSDPDVVYTTALLQTLLHHVERWRWAYITITPAFEALFLHSDRALVFSNLQYLHLRWRNARYQVEEWSPASVFRHMPAIQEMDIESLFLPIHVEAGNYPVLCSISVHGLHTPQAALNILSVMAETLKELGVFFYIRLDEESYSASLAFVKLKYLESLKIGLDPRGNREASTEEASRLQASFIDRLELPALRSLALQRPRWANPIVPGSDVVTDALRRLVMRSNCPLEKLEWRRVRFASNPSTLSFLRTLEGLREFSCTSRWLQLEIIDALKEIRDQNGISAANTIFPNLETLQLYLGYTTGHSERQNRIVSLLEPRTSRLLRSVTLGYDEEDNVDGHFYFAPDVFRRLIALKNVHHISIKFVVETDM